MTENKGDLISRSELKKAIEGLVVGGAEGLKDYYENGSKADENLWIGGIYDAWEQIDNAPTVELRMGRMTNGVIIPIERPQGEYVDISKLRLMTVEECAGHTIDYAMGWKACIEWIKKGGAENDIS